MEEIRAFPVRLTPKEKKAAKQLMKHAGDLVPLLEHGS
jgi:hypothetical protein